MNETGEIIEPEEIIEAKLIAIIAEVLPSVDVLGALSPFPDGEQKLSPDTYVSVFADVESQGIDWVGPNCPFSF